MPIDPSTARRAARLLTVSLAAVSLAACGGSQTPRPGSPEPGEAAARPLPAPGAFYTDGLPVYAAADGWAPDPLEIRLIREVGRALDPPPALDCLAREYAARFAADRADPDPGTVLALGRHCGYWTQPQHPYSLTAPDEAALLDHIRRLPAAVFEGTFGVGVAIDPEGPVTASFLRDPGEVRIDTPIARQTTAAPITGRLVRGDGRLELWMDGADGPQRVELTVSDVGRFSGTVPAEALRVELARKQGNFRRTVAVFDRGPRPAGYPPPGPDRQAAEAAAEQLIARINDVRDAAGLKPLVHAARLDPVLDDWLHRVAERSADDSPPGMLDARGWPFAELRYAIASGRDADQIVGLLVEAPTGRRAVLTADVQRIAVGLRPFEKGRGYDAVFAAVRPFEPTPPAEARAALLTTLNATRAQDGAPPLKPSPVLDRVAQALAEDALVGKVAWAEVVPGVMAVVRQEKLVRGAFAAGAFPTPNLEAAAFDQEPSALAPAVTVVGIGVAGGPLPGGGAPRHLVVYIVAEAVATRDI